MVESGRLESDYSVMNRIGGSNPPLSSKKLFVMKALHRDSWLECGMFRYGKSVLAVFIVMCCHMAHASVYDNRFIPLIQVPYVTVLDRYQYADVDVFFATSHGAFGRFDETVGIPELAGRYDEHQVAQAIALTGKPNPLVQAFPTDIDILRASLPWRMDGKIQAQGMQFSMRKNVVPNWLFLGFSWLFMRVDSWPIFRSDFNEQVISSPTTIAELDRIRLEMNDELGLYSAHSSQSGMGDLDLYARVSGDWDYVLKCRRIQASLSVGALVDTGVRRNINVPASIPFGGNGHPGFYFSGELELELKEDWKAGLLLRGNKRVARTRVQRMPADKEPYTYGAIVGCARVNPGGTIVFSPYMLFENLRDGFGACLQFTLTEHEKDGWSDRRPLAEQQALPAQLELVENLSSWRSCYVTLNAFYDFGKVKVKRDFDPVFTLAWSFPVGACGAYGSAKTQKVTVGFEFNF